MGRFEIDTHSCPQCKLPMEENIYTWQEFKNGDKHIKCTCGKYGRYLGYTPRTEPYLTLANGNDVVLDLSYWKARAQEAEAKLVSYQEKLKKIETIVRDVSF